MDKNSMDSLKKFNDTLREIIKNQCGKEIVESLDRLSDIATEITIAFKTSKKIDRNKVEEYNSLIDLLYNNDDDGKDKRLISMSKESCAGLANLLRNCGSEKFCANCPNKDEGDCKKQLAEDAAYVIERLIGNTKLND